MFQTLFKYFKSTFSRTFDRILISAYAIEIFMPFMLN